MLYFRITEAARCSTGKNWSWEKTGCELESQHFHLPQHRVLKIKKGNGDGTMSVSLLALLKIFTGLATHWLKLGNEYMGVIVQPFSLQHMLEIFHKKVKRKPEYQSRGKKWGHKVVCFFLKITPTVFLEKSKFFTWYLLCKALYNLVPNYLSLAPSLSTISELYSASQSHEPFWTMTFTFIFPVKLLLTGMSFLLYSPTQIAITMAKTGN